MIVLAKHKIVRIGRSSLVVVPKCWIESKNLKKGDKLAFVLEGDRIVLIPEKELHDSFGGGECRG